MYKWNVDELTFPWQAKVFWSLPKVNKQPRAFCRTHEGTGTVAWRDKKWKGNSFTNKNECIEVIHIHTYVCATIKTGIFHT